MNNKKLRVPVWIYGLVGVLLMVIGYRLMGASRTGEHPQPRAGVSAAKVMPASEWAAQPDVARIYAMAREIPEVLDGIYCYCNCSKHSHHYSLLTCYESDHAAMCDICLGEAALAYKLARQGKTLQEIRLAIDAQYG
ncbi:MAG TPA: CYCXC family (seleno)protein [Longimicrobiales bacterium]